MYNMYYPSNKSIMSLHIFDFDGTIFLSPTPCKKIVSNLFGNDMIGKLRCPVECGGLGWFQSVHSMCFPAVPVDPDLNQWYIPAMLARIREVSLNEHTRRKSGITTTFNCAEENYTGIAPDSQQREKYREHYHESDHPSVSKSKLAQENFHTQNLSHCFVLTGRDVKFRDRINYLLAHAGIRSCFTDVLLKPSETAGTVRFKLDTILCLVQKYKPNSVFYYEDRYEQGGHIAEGIRGLLYLLYPKIEPDIRLRLLTFNDRNICPLETNLHDLSSETRSSVNSPFDDEYTSTLSVQTLFDGKSEALQYARRRAKLWSQTKIDSFRRKNEEQLLRTTISGRASGCEETNKNASYDDIPCFSLTIFFVPQRVHGQTDYMLSKEKIVSLVHQLQLDAQRNKIS